MSYIETNFKLYKKQKIMMTIDNYKFAGKKAIVRVDFNVPLNEELWER